MEIRSPSAGAESGIPVPIRIVAATSDVRAVSGEAGARVGGLWHYDPWWVLDERRYARHPDVPVLKATNCAGRLRPGVKMLHYRGNLSRISMVTVRTARSIGLEPWQSAFLPNRETRPTPQWPAFIDLTWQLNPVWRMWSASFKSEHPSADILGQSAAVNRW